MPNLPRTCPNCGAATTAPGQLEGEVQRLQRMFDVLKFDIAMLYRHSRDIKGSFRVVDGRVQVWNFVEWQDLEEAQNEMDRELEGLDDD